MTLYEQVFVFLTCNSSDLIHPMKQLTSMNLVVIFHSHWSQLQSGLVVLLSVSCFGQKCLNNKC